MSEKPLRIAIVDDDPELRGLLQRYLGENGFAVRAAGDGVALERLLAREPCDLIVLDIALPGEDGLSICRRLRAQHDQTPIVMLTARGEPVDRIVGLEMGADDYLAKPFEPRELLARIAAIRRRISGLPPARSGQAVAFGRFSLDLDAMTLARDGAPIALSSREFALLQALATRPGRPLSRAQLIDLALGRDADVTDRAIDVLVARVRKAIEDDPAAPVWIRTVWGVGYVFATPGVRS
jgi:two-component system phosphate regulon response regulator OmpR